MRAFIAAAFLFAGIINFGMWYRPQPAVAQVKIASWLKTDKVQDRLVKTISIKPQPKVVVPLECRELAASVDMPTTAMTQDQVRRAKTMLEQARQSKQVRRCRAAIDKGLRDARCDGPARYEAMSEGANCS